MNRSRAGLLFRNSGFILALAFIFGLALPQGAPATGPSLTPLLAVIMTLSIMGVSPRIFLDFKRISRPVLFSLLLNYVVLTFTFIGLATLIIQDYELWLGFVLLAAIPAAVAVVPFTYRLEGDIDFSLVGTITTYLAAFFILPLVSTTFLGSGLIQTERLLMSLLQLVGVPLAISQLLRRTGVAAKLEKYRGTIINWSFFVVIYTIVGLNQGAFLEQPLSLMPSLLIAFISTFVLGYIVNRLARFRGVSKPSRISLILLVTRKNYGMAAAIALVLFGARAAVPAAVTTVLAIVHFIWLSLWVKKMD